MPGMNVFQDDAFGLISLTDAVNKLPYVPTLLDQLGIFESSGTSTTSVMIDERQGSIGLIPYSPRGGVPAQNVHNKRTARSLAIPHIALEDTIQADEVQNVRSFGTENELQTVQGIVNERLEEMTQKADVTLEYQRIGAVKGQILDADGSTVLLNLFTEFGVSAIADVNFDLDDATPEPGEIRGYCHDVIRLMRDELGATRMRGVWALCGADFFDALISHPEVIAAYERWSGNPIMAGAVINAATGQMGDFLRMGLVERSVEFGGIVFQEYRGAIGSVAFVDAAQAQFFPVGVPGLFRTVYAPADFAETVNTIGLPRYAKQAPDPEFNRYVKLHLQSNPLSYCTRPRVLIKGLLT